MKLFLVSLLCIGTALAANPQDALIAKANKITTLTEQALVEYRKAGKEHLLGAIVKQVSLIKALVATLKSDIAHHKTAAQLKADDDKINYHESRLSDELIILQNYLAHPKHQTGNLATILNHAKALITKSQTALAHDKVPAHQIVHADITYEIQALQHVIAQLQHKTNPAEHQKEMETLERSEISLSKLLTRIGVH